MEKVTASNSSDLSTEIQPSDSQAELGDHVLRMICYVTTLVVGVPGNCLILCVYRSKAPKTSTNILIMSLAVTDLLTCVFQIFDIASDVVYLSSGEESYFLESLELLEHTFLITSIGITVMIAVDRYDCVCRPQRRFFTKTTSKTATFMSVLVAVCVMAPQYVNIFGNYSNPTLDGVIQAFHLFILLFSFLLIILFYYKVFIAVRKHVKVGLPSNLAVLNVKCPRIDQSYQTKVTNKSPITLNATTRLIHMPLQTTSVASTSLSATSENASEGKSKSHLDPITSPMGTSGCRAPDQGHQHRGRPDRSPSLQRKTTRMLFVTSVVLMLTWLPYCVFICVHLAFSNGLSVDPVFIQILGKIHFILYVNNVCNPIIYGLANRRFRKDCMAVLRKVCQII